MKRSQMFVLWCFAALMFCAATMGGCGGGHDDTPAVSSVTSDDVAPVSDDVTPISGDVSGRNAGNEDWEDMTVFDMFDGTFWSVTNVQFIGQGVQKVEYDKDSLGFSSVQFFVSNYSNNGGEEAAQLSVNYPHTLDFSITLPDDRYKFSHEILVDGGYFRKYGDFFMTDPVNGNYYMMEMTSTKKSTKLTFTSTRYVPNGVLTNYQVVTTLELWR